MIPPKPSQVSEGAPKAENGSGKPKDEQASAGSLGAAVDDAGDGASGSKSGFEKAGSESKRSPVDLFDYDSDEPVVTYNGSTDSSEDLLDNKGNVSVRACFARFTGQDSIKVGVELTQALNEKHDPFAKTGGSGNGGVLSFISYVWDAVLETQFGRGKIPTAETNTLLWSLVPEMEKLNVEDFEPGIMQKFSSWLNSPDPEEKTSNRIQHICKANWYDVPSVFKVLAPSTESLVKTDYNSLRYYEQNAMKCLPHSIIMLPWIVFKLEKAKADIPQIPNRNAVRTIYSFVFFEICSLTFYIYSFFIVFPIRDARNLDDKKERHC